MGKKEEEEERRRRKANVEEARARNISHNVRCTECGNQSIEDSHADIAVLLRKLIREEIRSGKTDREVYKKLESDYGETVLYTPRFDLQTAALWLTPFIIGCVGVGAWAHNRHKTNSNLHVMALDLIRGIPLTPNERRTMLLLLTPPSPPPPSWRSWFPSRSSF